MKLSEKLTFNFIVCILITIFIISFISNTMINKRFEKFLVQEQENKFEKIQQDINNLYLENGYKLSQREILQYSSLEGIYIEVRDKNNNIISHSSKGPRKWINKGMMGHMNQMHIGNYVEKSFPLYDNEIIVGNIIIGYIDNSYLTKSALIFKGTLYKSFIISGSITILLGIIISILLSKELTKPLLNIRDTAIEIRKGNLKAKSNLKINTVEILQLSDAINFLGDTLSIQDNIRKKYATDIAHELRTPLTTLQTHIEAMLDGVWEISEVHLNILMEEIKRLSKLVDNLKLSFNSKENKLNINKINFNISKEIKNIVNTFKPICFKENYALEYLIEDDIYFFMDKDNLKQIIYNLLSNSIRYLKDDGKIIVSLLKEKDRILIKVQDNGIGIKQEDLKFIFNMSQTF